MDIKKSATQKQQRNFRTRFTEVVKAETKTDSVRDACKKLGISRETFYQIARKKKVSPQMAWRLHQQGIAAEELLRRAGA